jgi:zeaxanthin epoxidase
MLFQAYLGDAMPGPLNLLSKLKIPHPGRVLGQVVMKLAMPGVLGWVLGGNMTHIERSRDAHCR